jgi:hypothetical protein
MDDDIILPPDSDLSANYSVPNPIPDDMEEQLKDAKIVYINGPLEYFEPLVQLMRDDGYVVTEIGGVKMEEIGGPREWGEEPRAMTVTVLPKNSKPNARENETFYMCRYGHYDPVFVMTQTDKRTQTRHLMIMASVVEVTPLRDLIKRVEDKGKLTGGA